MWRWPPILVAHYSVAHRACPVIRYMLDIADCAATQLEQDSRSEAPTASLLLTSISNRMPPQPEKQERVPFINSGHRSNKRHAMTANVGPHRPKDDS